ncbi:MAG: alpha/beta hydrolase [Rubrivivax sp.]|nr:MAG: alpha/beta hydrolase [Rubrivivax sp.]
MKLFFKSLAGLLALLVVILLAVVAITWAPDRPVQSLTAQWAPPPSQFIDLMGLRVHLRDEGPRDDPQPIVLLHGTSASLHTWDGWVAQLKGQRRVIRLDLPGFGLTGPWPDHDYGLDHYVRFMTAVLDQLGVKHCVVVGNSFGGGLAWEMAVALPQRVDRLVLIDSAGYAYKPESIPVGFRAAQMPALQPLVQRILPRSMVASSVRNVYADPAKVTPELVNRYYELTLREGNRLALHERFKQVRGGEHAARIAQVKQPTFILWGREDHLIPLALGERFHADIAGSQMAVLDGLGHVPHEEDPARSLAAIQPFLGLH